MTIDPNIAKVQPGDDRALLDDVPPQNMLSFDLETPETVSDEYKGAAARRISEAFKVPDPDGRIWRGDKGAFPTGAEYLDYMRGMVKSGDIFEYSATPELKEFAKADAAGRLAIAKKSIGFAENAAGAISKAVTPEGYGLPDNDPRLSGAPQEVLAANSRLRMRQEAVSMGDAEPSPEDKAARAAVDTWRTQRDDTALINSHHGKLMEKNAALLYLNLAPSLSDKGREIAANAFKNRKLAGSDIADFQRLDENEQAIIAKLARMARKPIEGSFLNTMGDASIGFLNGILSTPGQAIEQLGSVDRKIFGKMSGIVDDAELNRRAREKQRLMEALDDPTGINPSGAEHGYLARAVVGAASTLPYMAYASVPYVGGAVIAAQFMQQVDDQIAAEGGDVYGRGPEVFAYQLVAGAMYCGVEKVQALVPFGKDIGLAKNLMFVKLFSKHGAAAAEKVALHIGKDTFTESFQEGVQGVIQQNAASVGLDRGPGWRESFNQGVRDFTESLGTMGIIAGIGAGRQAYSARSQRGKDILFDTAVNSGRQVSFLLADNPYAGRASEDETARALGEVHTEKNRYQATWAQGGAAALVKKHRMTEDQAAILDHAFSADAEKENNDSLIEGRNIYMRSASKGIAHEDDTPDGIRKLVAESGAQAQEKLMERGYTESGAAKVAEYYTAEADSLKLVDGVLKDIIAKRTAEWTQPEAVDKRAQEAARIAADLQPLRSIFQRAGTTENAVKEFQGLKFTLDQSKAMAGMFENEHRLATSPQAAAAFRAAYLDSSEEESAASRLKRMTGFESEAAPEHGEGATRLTLKDNDGKTRGSVLYLPDQSIDFDPEGRHAWEAVNAALPDTVTADEWQAFTPAQRKAFAEAYNIRPKGGFEVTDENDPAIRADGAQADLLTGKLTLAPDAPSATLYHEAAHAWAAVMRRAGKLTDADIQKLQTAYGVAENDKGWFNEEKFADDIREIGAARDFTPDRTLASRFIAAVKRFAGTARHEQTQRKASADALQSIFESVVYGRAFDGVGDLKAAVAQSAVKDALSTDTASDPMAGAVTAKAEDTPAAAETAAQKPAGSRKPVKKTDGTAWTAATIRENLRVSGYWLIAPRGRFISDTDPRYDFSLQDRRRDDTKASEEQVSHIATQGVFDGLFLLDSANTLHGAPIAVPVQLKNPETGKEEEYFMLVTGNGRFRSLDKIDDDNRGDEYRNPVKMFADEKGIPYKPEDMTAEARPRLVRVITKKPEGKTIQEIARLSNKEGLLQKTDAEKATTDAELIERDGAARLFNANKDGLPSKTGNTEFFAWFARVTGDESLLDSNLNPTAAGRERARLAILAFVIGEGKIGKDTIKVFLETSESLGIDKQRDALLMSAGYLSALEEIKPDYGLREALSSATASFIELARLRKSGRNISADEHIGQIDFFNEASKTQAELVHILDSSRPAEGIAEVFRRYTDLASEKNTETNDMFGDADAKKSELLKKAIQDTAVPAGVRYSIAIAARRYALSVNMPAEGEKLLARQLEFLFSRQMDPEYREKTEMANRKRQATIEGKRKDAEDKRLHGIRNATAEALNNPGSPEAWRKAFDKAGDTVSRIVHDFFIQDGPQRFPQTYAGKSIIGLKINNSHDVAALLMPLRNPYQESAKVVFLDDKNRVLGAQVVTVGLLNKTLIHPREFFKKGIKLGASGIVVSHNHPSGNPSPSDDDRKITDMITEAGRILGIEYVDHIITNGNSFYSFKDAMVRAVANETPDWEAVPAGTGDKLTKAYDAASLANVLRQSSGDYIHAILLDVHNRIAAVHRMPYDPKTTSPATVARSVFKAAAGNATYAIILDLTADGITRETAENLHRMIKDQSRIMGMDLYDSIYQDQGWAASIRNDGKPAAPVLPLTSKAAENKDVRYSVAAASASDWMRSYYDESYGDQQAGRERDEKERLAEEYASVEAEHTHPNGKRKDSWMLAPNGKPSELNPRNWVLVRTPSFKKWFGDWEKFANAKDGNRVWTDANKEVSKAVDKNGEPLVVYHGTERFGFTILDPEKADTHRSPMIFSSNHLGTARSYSGGATIREVQDADKEALNDVTRELFGDGEFFDTLSAENKTLVEKYYRSTYLPEQSGVYPLFLNIRDPNETDFEGANWDGDRAGWFEIFDEDGEKYYDKTGKGYFSDADAEEIANEQGEWTGKSYEWREAPGHHETTNTVSEEALRLKQDGVIIRNVVDDGGRGGDTDTSDVFVIFDSSQAKSAIQNTGAFDANNPDIRYSVQTRRLEPMMLPDSMAEASAGTSVAALSQTKFKDERAQHKVFRDSKRWEDAEAYARSLTGKNETRLLGQYLLAKYHGDIEAAEAVVEKWAKPSEALRLKSLIGDSGLLRPIITAPVGQIEGNRFNALPMKYADWLAKQLSGFTSMPIIKVRGEANTGAAMADRTSRDYEFSGGGDIDSASPIFLVDDVWTSGQTLWTAYEHIKAINPSANIVAFATLASGRYGKNIRPTQKQLTAFQEKSKLSPTSFKERIGNEIEKLIGSEIQAYILTGKSGPDGAAEFFGGGSRGSQRNDGKDIATFRSPDLPIRYAIDVTGRAYDKESALVGFMASYEMTGASFPSRNTVALYAQDIGLESYDYGKLADKARTLARSTEDTAIKKALASGDPTKTAYAIGELSRKAALAYVRSGAHEGVRLAKNADRLHGMTEANARKTMQLMTGADYASIENDTGIDVAATILYADPKKFNPQAEAEKKPIDNGSASADLTDEQKPAEVADENPETDEDAPGLTDQQRAEIVRKRAEHEARIKDFLASVAKRGTENRFREEERRRKAKEAKAAAEASGDASSADGTGDAASGVKPETATQQDEDFGPALPVDFTDRWDAAAFLRVWAFDRFSRENPNRLTRDITKDRVAIEFYRKTAVRELTELARKLLEPGYKREIVLLSIGEITPGLKANEIERKTAYVFGRLNRYAVRDGTKKLIKQFRNEIKRQYIKGEKFEELGVDLGRTITGGVEEDARYVAKICELSEKHADGETSPLNREEARLKAIINERENLTDMDGNPLAVGDDDQMLRKANRQLALLAQFGGMVDMMPGEILDLTGKALDSFGQEAIALRQRWEKYDLAVKSIRDPLAGAIARGIDDPAVEPTAFEGIIDSLTGMLRLRLDKLTRFADPEKREPARAAIADIMDLLAQGNTEHTMALQGDEAALVGALGKILTRPDGRPDPRRIRAYLKRMDQKIPLELSQQLTRQQKQGLMTYGQMIQLLTSLEQTGGFMRNIQKNNREKQADLIRSYTYEDAKTGEIKKALTNEDMLFVEWLRREFYPQKRDVLSVIFQRLCGRPVDNPDPLYCPAKFLIPQKTGMNDVSGSAWQAIDGVFSRRVSHTLDFDEQASILDMFRDRSRKSALLTAYGERGLVLREVLTSSQFQDAVRIFHGQEALSQILAQVTQALNGGKTRAKNDKQTAAFDLAMKATTYVGIGWNLQSAFKQTASLPVFANVLGYRKFFSIMAGPIDQDAVRRLKESDEYRVRYGTGPASGMDIASRGAYEDPDKSAFQKFFCDWGLYANRKADWFISAWIGQGIYRDLKAKYLDNGMDEANAERRAISETFSAIEETQQSGRTENTMALTRDHGRLGKVFTQFATSPLQQMQYELVSFSEWRNLVANKGPAANIAEARNRFMRALFINHVIVPLIMTGIAGLYKGATGGEPDWKKDGFWQTLLISAIMGQFSRILFAGAFTEQTLRALFLRKPPNMGQLLPAEGIIRFSATMAYPVRDIALWDMENFQSDIKRALKSTAVTRLPTVLYENYAGEEEE